MYLFCVRGNFAKGRIGELNFNVYRRWILGGGGVESADAFS
jgi:hypothetical protein